MTAMHHEPDVDEARDGDAGPAEPAAGGGAVEVRRNAGLAALVGGGAAAIAIAYMGRAGQTGSALDWVLFAAMALIAGWHLARLLDARTPLVVADALGVRIRLGHQWRGLPWDAVAEVGLQPRRGLLRDGRLCFRPHSMERALDGLEGRSRRIAALNRRLYGGALAVPLGLTTRTSPHAAGLAEHLARLAGDRVGATAEPAPPQAPPQPATDDPAPRGTLRGLVGGVGTVVSRVAKRRQRPTAASEPAAPSAPAAFVAPLRQTRPGRRAEVTREAPASTLGATALHEDAVSARTERSGLPEGRELRRPGSVPLVFESPGAGVAEVRPISTLGDPVAPLVIEDFPAEPATDPVIGPELAAARTRVGLTVDELAERTRIRPHVIESIEVDDFGPCGGDFYARGHLRTLARVLGQDPAPLLDRFDNRYATAPINARRVFEAELASGTTGSLRSTVGGPSWGLLVGAVLSLLLVWGVVRYVATEPPPVVHSPAPVLNGSAGVQRELPVDGTQDSEEPRAAGAVRVTLVASRPGSRVTVRDDAGEVVYTGRLGPGERTRLRAQPPVRVRARDAGAITVRVAGADRGRLGEPGRPGGRTFRR